MILKLAAIFLAELGLGIIFNIHSRKLLAAAATGTLGILIYELTLNRCGEIAAMFFAACVICTSSEMLARKMKTPVTTFLICALIPLVPGGGMYYTMLEIIRGSTMSALQTGLHTLGCAGALALGVALTSALFPIFHRRSR